VVVGKWTGDVDEKRMREVLANESEAQAQEPEQVLDVVEHHMPAGAARPAAA
jgi:aerobic C4-dicarboxylate transport protein